MWNGKNKAITFSFDDGVTQDIRLIDIFNRYGLKATFNLNSSLLGLKGIVSRNGKETCHDKVRACDIKSIYAGHEIAVHTLTHPNLPTLDDETVIFQVEKDRLMLSELAGYKVVGMAYPGGGENNNERVAEVIRKNTGVKYARTIVSTHNFDLQNNLFRFNPSVYYIKEEELFKMGREFVEMKTDKPQLFYIWGHSYEMDADWISWERFEEFCKFISNRNDIFYGANKEVLLNENI